MHGCPFLFHSSLSRAFARYCTIIHSFLPDVEIFHTNVVFKATIRLTCLHCKITIQRRHKYMVVGQQNHISPTGLMAWIRSNAFTDIAPPNYAWTDMIAWITNTWCQCYGQYQRYKAIIVVPVTLSFVIQLPIMTYALTSTHPGASIASIRTTTFELLSDESSVRSISCDWIQNHWP